MSRVAPAGQFAHAPRGAEFGGVGWFCGPRFWWGETATFLLGVAPAGQFAHVQGRGVWGLELVLRPALLVGRNSHVPFGGGLRGTIRARA